MNNQATNTPKTHIGNVNIFTLAEKQSFWHLLFNAMEWKPEPTYKRLKLGPGPVVDEDAPLKILKRFIDGGGQIVVKHLFRTFTKDMDDPACSIKYLDDSMAILRLIFSFKEGFPVLWNFDLGDQDTLDELSFLSHTSPPLYNKLMKQFATQFQKALHEKILDAVQTEMDDFCRVHYGASYNSFLILISPSMDEVFAYADATPEEIEMSAFRGWPMDSIKDIKEASSLTDKHSKRIADGLLSYFLP